MVHLLRAWSSLCTILLSIFIESVEIATLWVYENIRVNACWSPRQTCIKSDTIIFRLYYKTSCFRTLTGHDLWSTVSLISKSTFSCSRVLRSSLFFVTGTKSERQTLSKHSIKVTRPQHPRKWTRLTCRIVSSCRLPPIHLTLEKHCFPAGEMHCNHQISALCVF